MSSYLESSRLKDCSGCGACVEACPIQCIEMKQANDGFLFPVVNSELCIKCNKCVRTCPYTTPVESYEIKASYAGKSSNKKACLESSSGGLFYALASKVISEGGIVVGASFNDNYICEHRIVTKIDDLLALIGSKYVQSDCHRIYPLIKQELINDKIVLFVGTPCQVAGLKNYLENGFEKLICIDIACHGVPSAADFEKCKTWIENKHEGKLTYIKFRDKNCSGWNHSVTYKIVNKKKEKIYTVAPYKVPYYYFFLHTMNIRKSCYSCPYVGITRCGDITLADFWRAERLFSEEEIGKGISAVLCNTEKGKEILDKCKTDIQLKNVDVPVIVEGNQPFKSHSVEYSNRESLLLDILQNGYADTRKYLSKKEYFLAVVKAAIPENIKRDISRRLRNK